LDTTSQCITVHLNDAFVLSNVAFVFPNVAFVCPPNVASVCPIIALLLSNVTFEPFNISKFGFRCRCPTARELFRKKIFSQFVGHLSATHAKEFHCSYTRHFISSQFLFCACADADRRWDWYGEDRGTG
jgi:hypothetical protein